MLVFLSDDSFDRKVDSSLSCQDLHSSFNFCQIPSRVSRPLIFEVKSDLPLISFPCFLAPEVQELADIEQLSTGLECTTLRDNLALTGLSFLHIIKSFLLILLALHGFKDLETAKFIVALDRLDKNEAPLLELLSVIEGHLDGRLIWTSDLNEEFAIVAVASADLTLAEVDNVAWCHFLYKNLSIVSKELVRSLKYLL